MNTYYATNLPPLEGLEPSTPGLEVLCAIQLRYKGKTWHSCGTQYFYILFYSILNALYTTASNQSRTGVIGFKVQCANHYTMEA